MTQRDQDTISVVCTSQVCAVDDAINPLVGDKAPNSASCKIIGLIVNPVAGMGAEGLAEASDISVLANNYMEKGLLAIRGVTRSYADAQSLRLEMTRYSLQQLKEETGIDAHDVQNRMTDFGVDAMWSSHHPWLVPEPFTPEPGEMYGKKPLDTWIAVLTRISEEAYSNSEIVKAATHNQAIHRLKGAALEDPEQWAMT
ncbi:hypothetical protein [Vreelandella sedimenti]|uniref:hypothetical protein n=1 Tax=Vreelandella sedimenti TaxID=2729618 RepID=UPI00257BA493|nr:hypothetical protein [Halomonas sp. UBA3173]|tara:strand:- start:40088 stop:40684 length:597 start_codon:yes stop_codon:yes gene_type:complete